MQCASASTAVPSSSDTSELKPRRSSRTQSAAPAAAIARHSSGQLRRFVKFECQSVARASRGSAAPGIQLVVVAAEAATGFGRGSSGLEPVATPALEARGCGRAQRQGGCSRWSSGPASVTVQVSSSKGVHMQFRGRALHAQAQALYRQGQGQSQPNPSFKRTAPGVPVSAA
jgi:hypothetical protein